MKRDPHLGVKRFQQSATESLCGVKAIQSVYDYFDNSQDDDYFIRELALVDDYAYLPQLLRLAAKDKYKVHINISNPYLFDLTWNMLPQEKLIQKLRSRILNLDTTWTRVAQEYLFYLGEGNTLGQNIINEKLIANYVLEKKLVIAFLDNVIYQRRGQRYWDETKKTYELDDIRGMSDGHAIVIDGWSQKKGFHVVDSSSIQKYSPDGTYWLDPSIIIAGIYTFSGEIGVIWK